MKTNDLQLESHERRKHLWISIGLLAVILIILAILYRGLSIDQGKIPSALIGKSAEAFTVDVVQGSERLRLADPTKLTLDSFKGKVLVLNFWASWCVSCRSEAKDLEMIWRQFRDRDVFVVGVAIQDTQEAAKTFAAQLGKTYILGLDVDGKAAIDYGVAGVPETFVIDRNGEIVHKETGPVNTEELVKVLQKLLQGAPSPSSLN